MHANLSVHALTRALLALASTCQSSDNDTAPYLVHWCVPQVHKQLCVGVKPQAANAAAMLLPVLGKEPVG